MRTKIFYFLTCLLSINLFFGSLSATSASDLKPKQKTLVTFKENRGQVCDQYNKPRPDVLFSGTDGNLVYHLKQKGISYQLTRVDAWKGLEDPRSQQQDIAGEKKKIAALSTIYRIDISWLNANSNFIIEKGEALEGIENYYTTTCPTGITNVKNYKSISYKNIYNGIDIKWYEKNGSLEYDFIIQPGADHKQIQLQINGARKLLINKKGELEITTPLGTIIEKAPTAYQNKKTISSQWQLNGNIVSFKLGEHNTIDPIVIDPCVRLWGTYYGGTGIEYGYGCATDPSGNVYMCGFTQTTNSAIMCTTGAHQTTSGGGTNDSFLAKFNTNGTRLWATFYGGGGLDLGTCCAVDPFGNIFMSGYTDSNNNIGTAGSYQANAVGNVEAFLVKFNSAGVRQWGTYYADTLNEYGYGCATDVSGNAYLCGYTTSSNGILVATPGSHQPIHGGGLQDAFLVKFNAAGIRQWGTYYGGTGNDFGFNCATDPTGNVFLTGRTASTNSAAISTPGSHQPISGGNFDAYLVKFNSSGIRQWGTHYGGFGIDYGYGVVTDASGNVFLSGSTDSQLSTEIATTGSHQSVFGGGPGDAYVAKFSSGGVRQWGTYYGGVNYEEGVTCATDVLGNVYIGGQTSSATSTIMATANSHQALYGGGTYDAYLAKFTTNGARVFGTYYGETGSDYGFACAVDANSYIYLVGYTNTLGGTSIATIGSHQPTMGGGTFDAFLAKFFDCPVILPDFTSQNNVSCYGYADGSASATVNIAGNYTYSWSPISIISPTITNLSPGFYTCVITNTCGSMASLTLQITQPPSISLTATSNTSLMCVGDVATLTAIGSGGVSFYTYTWNPGPVSNTAVINPTVNTTYSVTVADANGCSVTTTLTQNVSICTGIFGGANKNESLFNVFPNPNNGEFYITANSKIILNIFNTLGQLVTPVFLDESANKQAVILNLASGIYYIVALNNGHTITQKIIVAR